MQKGQNADALGPATAAAARCSGIAGTTGTPGAGANIVGTGGSPLANRSRSSAIATELRNAVTMVDVIEADYVIHRRRRTPCDRPITHNNSRIVRFVRLILKQHSMRYMLNYRIKVIFRNQLKLENVAIIAMYCHLRPPDAIAFPT